MRFALFILPDVIDQREMLRDKLLNLSWWQLCKNVKLASPRFEFFEELEECVFRRVYAGLRTVNRFFRADNDRHKGRFAAPGQGRLHCGFDRRRNEPPTKIWSRKGSWSF